MKYWSFAFLFLAHFEESQEPQSERKLKYLLKVEANHLKAGGIAFGSSARFFVGMQVECPWWWDMDKVVHSL